MESARLHSTGLQRVGHDWATNIFMCSHYQRVVSKKYGLGMFHGGYGQEVVNYEQNIFIVDKKT